MREVGCCAGMLLGVLVLGCGCGPLFPCAGEPCISELDIRVNRSDGTQATNFRGTVGGFEVRCSSEPGVDEKHCAEDRILIDGFGDGDREQISIDLETTGSEPTERLDEQIELEWQETGVDRDQCPTCYRAQETVVLEPSGS